MPTNRLLLTWRALPACAVALAALVCGSSPANPSATTEPAAAAETVLHTFVGHLARQPALRLALLVGRDLSIAYLGDNHGGPILLSGTVSQQGSGGSAALKTEEGITFDATFGVGDAAGTVTLTGKPADPFTAQLANVPAGLYEAAATAAGGTLRSHWIAGNAGHVAGTPRLDRQMAAHRTTSRGWASSR